jgi:cell wall-associated NlpC family hydrolase
LIGSVLVLGAVVAAPLAAHALPRSQSPAASQPLTSAQVTAKLQALAKSSEQLSEQLNAAKIDIAKAQRTELAAIRNADLAQTRLHNAQQQLAVSLASQYKAATFSRTVALLSSNSSENYLQTVQSMSLLTEHQGQVATIATDAIADATRATATAKSAVTAAQQKQAALVKQQQALTAETSKYKTLLATLTAAERVRYFTPSPPPPAAAVTQVLNSATPKVVGQGAAAAINMAKAQLGKPYVWGAAGPGSFDCSGLTMYAWAAAGVSLPHNAAAQQGLGTPVAQGDLQPGDLVFFGSPAYHVGLYVGDGMMIHAPTTGDVVKMSSLSYMSDYSGATRVG